MQNGYFRCVVLHNEQPDAFAVVERDTGLAAQLATSTYAPTAQLDALSQVVGGACCTETWEVVKVCFVHGHARDTGWVKAHLRRPRQPEHGQLPLLTVVVPEPCRPRADTRKKRPTVARA